LICPFLVLLISNQKPHEHAQKETLNILLIIADDLGYADIGAYGGDIETPNMDEIATNGIKFSRFHTAPYCAVTRSMVLTGNDNHIAGMGSQDNVTKVKGYEGRLTNRVVTIPQLLRDKNYMTFMAGKWHLGKTQEANPHNKGFDKSFVLLEGAGNHYSNRGVLGDSISSYTENGKKTDWPEGKYSTEYYTDKLIGYMSEAKKANKPFFGFAAYTSPHWPLQVDQKYWQKYKGRYDGGYDSLRIARLKSLKSKGIIPQNIELPELHPNIKPWDSLLEQEKIAEARKMELYAGMVDNLDVNIGRLINHLKEIGEYDNTLIVIMSDNGAAAEDFFNSNYLPKVVRDTYDNTYANMGSAKSYVSYGKQWAEAGSAPFKYYKGYPTEGGITTPMLISGPMVKKRGATIHSFLTLMDLAPTFYELIGVDYPKTYNGNPISRLRGASLVPIINDEAKTVHSEDYVYGFEHRGRAIIIKGDWKLSNIDLPFEMENFKLFNLKNDMAEANDLSKVYPLVYDDLMKEWKTYEKEVGVVIPTPRD
jgi:arylsulfatase